MESLRLYSDVALPDVSKVVQHVVNDDLVLGPLPLDIHEPGHGHDPAKAWDPPHLVLEDDLGVVVGARMVQASPQEVPISPAMHQIQ